MMVLGLTKKEVGKIFLYQGWIISLSGCVAGLAIGSILLILQSNFDFSGILCDKVSLEWDCMRPASIVVGSIVEPQEIIEELLFMNSAIVLALLLSFAPSMNHIENLLVS